MAVIQQLGRVHNLLDSHMHVLVAYVTHKVLLAFRQCPCTTLTHYPATPMPHQGARGMSARAHRSRHGATKEPLQEHIPVLMVIILHRVNCTQALSQRLLTTRSQGSP